jgi:prolyl 4-hydroxylase
VSGDVSEYSNTTVRDLLSMGKVQDAIHHVEGAAARGNPNALFRLASWLLVGEPLARDLDRARAVLRRAVEIGHVDAALLEIALTANGSGGAPDWGRALALLRVAAQRDPVAEQHLALLGKMKLAADGAPADQYAPDRLSSSPDVHYVRGLLSREECAHVAQVANDLLEPAVVVDPRTGAVIEHPIRTSFGAVIGPAREDLVIGAINRRIAAVSETAVEQGEPLSVLRYAPGQQYRPHFDTFADVANQRVKTVLVYLNEGYRGGETRFDRTGLTIAGRTGDALIFRNLLPNGVTDPLSLHAGLPVSSHVKWLATRWIRERPYSPWFPA